MKNWFFLRSFPNPFMGLCRASLLYTAVLFLAPQALAQFNVYHPFPDSNAVWGMTSGCMDGQCGASAYIQNYYLGDTLIDVHVYMHIDETYVVTSNTGCCSPPSGLGPGYLRDDAVNKRVYWRYANSNQDTLLYDFTLALGDTFVSCLNVCNMTWTVESIDSIMIGNDYRRRINFDESETCVSFSIIEGIGSTNGLTTCPYMPFEMGSILRCVIVGDSVLYNAVLCPDISPCGDLTSDVGETIVKFSNRVNITPNPTSDILSLTCGVSLLPMEASILNLTGECIMKRELTNARTDIAISNLAKGVYLIQMQRNGAVVAYEKFIKQ